MTPADVATTASEPDGRDAPARQRGHGAVGEGPPALVARVGIHVAITTSRCRWNSADDIPSVAPGLTKVGVDRGVCVELVETRVDTGGLHAQRCSRYRGRVPLPPQSAADDARAAAGHVVRAPRPRPRLAPAEVGQDVVVVRTEARLAMPQQVDGRHRR